MDSDNLPGYARDAALLFFAILLFFCIGLAARPYLTPSEARYIEIPRQMLATGDWLTPRINGVPYFEKPPLFYWMQAAVLSWMGAGEFAGRIATAILMALTCLITYAATRMLYGRLSGLFAALVLATSLLGYSLSRVAMLDVPVTLFITATIACFLAARQTSALPSPACGGGPGMGSGTVKFYWAMYIASALAVLTKGLIGIVVPALVIGGWIALTRCWRILKEARLLPGMLLFLAIAAPWHILMAQKHPAFLDFYFIHEHFTRYLTDEHKRTAPWWFFLAVTFIGLLPWTGVTAGALKKHLIPARNSKELFLILWIALPLLFYSVSHSKLVPYIFPIFPPLAVLTGDKLASLWRGELPVGGLRKDAYLVLAVFAAAAATYALLPHLSGKAGRELAAFAPMPYSVLLPLLAVWLWLAYAALTKRTAPVLIISLAAFGATAGLTANYLAGGLDPMTVKPLAQTLIEKLHPDDMVVAYGSYWQDLPVYLNRNVTVAGWEGELDFGVEHYPQTRQWMIGKDEFWRRCATETHRVYVFMRMADFQALSMPDTCRLRPLANHGKTVLLERQPQ